MTSRSVLDLLRMFRRFTPFVAPDSKAMLVTALTILLAVATNTAMIWLIGMPFDLVQRGQYDAVMQVLAWFALVVVVNQTMQYSGGRLIAWIGLRVIGRIRSALIERLAYISFAGAGRWTKGDLLARLNNDIDNIKNSIVDAPQYFLSHVLTSIIYLSMLFWIDSYLALVALALTPLYMIHQRIFGAHKRRSVENFLARRGELVAFEEETLSNLRGISAANAEGYVTATHKRFFEAARRWAMRERATDVNFTVGFSILIYATGIFIVFFGLDGIQRGRFGPGYLVSFLLYLGYLTVPARGFADIIFNGMGNLGAADRVLAILSAEPIVTEKQDARELNDARGELVLEDVTFGYPGSDRLFKEINLHIRAGETIALVGPSGCGKSTLAQLLLRFYDVDAGRILIDDIDIRLLRLSALRRNIAIVWQEPFVVSGTLRDNLLMYSPTATDDQLIAACKSSRAWEFIEALPDGLNSRLGAGGTQLSTGQKQRIAITQAILQDAPILIMDEATSALDSQSEQAIGEAMDLLRQGRTTILIAHRYSSLKSADRVVYFNGDGTITVGNHESLLEAHPGYKGAVAWQTNPVNSMNRQFEEK